MSKKEVIDTPIVEDSQISEDPKPIETLPSLTIEEVDFAEATWKVVPSYFRGAPTYDKLDSVKSMLDGNTIEIPKNTAVHRLYRWATAHGYKLRKRTLANSLIIWLEKVQEEEKD